MDQLNTNETQLKETQSNETHMEGAGLLFGPLEEGMLKPGGDTQAYNAFSLMMYDFGKARMPVDNFIAEGVTLLVGASKSGKSWLALDMCMKVATGAEFLGMRTQRGRVWYYALEDSPRRLRNRISTLTDGAVSVDIASLELFFEAAQGTGFAQGLAARLNETKKELMPSLIVIDTLQMARGLAGAYINAYASDYQFIRSLKEIAARHTLAIVLIHHTNKLKTSDDVYDRVNGSTGLMGAADTTIILERARDENEAVISGVGRDVCFENIKARFDNGLWTKLDGEKLMQEELVADPLVQTLCLVAQEAGYIGKFFSYTDIGQKCALVSPDYVLFSGRELASRVEALSPFLKEKLGISARTGCKFNASRGIRIALIREKTPEPEPAKLPPDVIDEPGYRQIAFEWPA